MKIAHSFVVHSVLALSVFALAPSLACKSSGSETAGGSGGSSQTGGHAIELGGTGGAGGVTVSGGSITSSGGASATGGSQSRAGGAGGSIGVGGSSANGGSSASVDAPQNDKQIVAMVQSTKEHATDLTASDVASLVADAVTKAGGLGFIKDGQTVVLKPNLVTAYTDIMATTPAPQTVNGIATDWRVVKAVADLVRAANPKGKILVMEGSVNSTPQAFTLLGYTQANFGSAVDEFVAIEGTSCTDTTTGALEQRKSLSGAKYWVNSRYANADVVISLPTMKTHLVAGITGGVKNLGIGTTPVGQFPSGTNTPSDCTRGQTSTAIDHSSPETLGQFIRDYYSIRPADFVVMDALQGLEHGPAPAWDSSGSYDYESSKKNMRLILAGRNAVAVDTIEALVMKCDPKKVPHLTKLEADGLGTTDTSKITVVGKQVSDVATPFACAQTTICPGT
jgi:uncharacterized protein (DUF362 family)